MKKPLGFFANLEDPRVDRTKEHMLEDIYIYNHVIGNLWC